MVGEVPLVIGGSGSPPRAGGSSALLPVFFVVTGLSVDVAGLDQAAWAMLGLVCVLAVAGMVGGGALSARLAGLSTRDSLSIAPGTRPS